MRGCCGDYIRRLVATKGNSSIESTVKGGDFGTPKRHVRGFKYVPKAYFGLSLKKREWGFKTTTRNPKNVNSDNELSIIRDHCPEQPQTEFLVDRIQRLVPKLWIGRSTNTSGKNF